MTTYRTADVDGVEVFHREAGDPRAPTLLLLHGFPTSPTELAPSWPTYQTRSFTYASARPTAVQSAPSKATAGAALRAKLSS